MVRVKRNPTWAEGGKVILQPELLEKFFASLGPEEAEVAFQAIFLRLLAEGEKCDLGTAISAAYKVRTLWDIRHKPEWANAVKWGVHYLLESAVAHVKERGYAYAMLLRERVPAFEDRLVGAGLLQKIDKDRARPVAHRPVCSAPPPCSHPSTPARDQGPTVSDFSFP